MIKCFENDPVIYPKYFLENKFVAIYISVNFHLRQFEVRLHVSWSEIPKFVKFNIQRTVHRDIFL
jgi:hypothetical protein